MKNPVQVSEKNSAETAQPQPKATPRSRVKVRISREFRAAVENAARKRGLTKSQFAESAIREELARVGAAGKGRVAKPRRPLGPTASRDERRRELNADANKKDIRGVVIPQEWNEVASIDFEGYVDRDCAERIIYKTPQGELKARKSFDDGGTVIENVTRPQVARWILECVIPEEFEPDFRRALSNAAAKGGAN